MSKSKGIQLSQLPAAMQTEVQKQFSRDLGRGNGPTTPQPKESPISRNKPTATWFRATTQGIHDVEVTIHGGKVRLPNGQMELIEHPGWKWFAAFDDAVSWVTWMLNARREICVRQAEAWAAELDSPKYEELRRKYNKTTSASPTADQYDYEQNNQAHRAS